MDAETLATRSGVAKERIASALIGSAAFAESEVEALAHGLAIAPEAFFVSQMPATASLIDYRRDKPKAVAPDAGTMTAMAFVEQFSGALVSLGISMPEDVPQEVVEKYDSGTAIELARKWRVRWGYKISQQVADQDAGKVYNSLRAYIEKLGAFVVHFSFGHADVSGFYTRVGGGPHTIVINTYLSNKGRRTFTLAHEFCHLLTRTEGVSDASWVRNKIEKFCNKFASVLLAPSSLIKLALGIYSRPVSADNDFIRLFSKRIGLSQDATFLRLVELNHLSEKAYSQWRAQFAGRIPPGDSESAGGGAGKPNPVQAKRTQYGEALLNALDNAQAKGLIDEIDVYRIVGLKPKFQSELFGKSTLVAS